MNLHEFQSKRLFAEHGLPISKGIVINSVDDASKAIDSLDGNRWVAKVQVHAGGRGKAGGVQLVESLSELEAFAQRWLGNHIHTVQTRSDGQPVTQIYVEEVAEIARELYLGVVIDRSQAAGRRHGLDRRWGRN